MRVRILGPLEIFDDGGWRRPGTAKQRSLLAALVVAGGNTVSTDQLIETLWNGRIPATAVNLIQGHVMRLRRALDDPSGELLRTQPGGYRLALPEGELDADVFEGLVKESMIAVESDEQERASALLTKALGLWRGPAIADALMSPAVEVEAGRLEQLRLTALETRIDADLELGRHNVLVPELQQLVEAHQLREPFWDQLMRALYRSGRRADALATYERLRGVLETELGVEPTKSIQDLRNDILTDGPAADPSPTRRPEAGTVYVPRQLPTQNGGFTGRTAIVPQLDGLVSGDHESGQGTVPIIVITGPAGVGKTSLALHWAHRSANRFPDGQLYVDLRGFAAGPAVGVADAVRGFLECLGVPTKSATPPAGQIAQYRGLFANRRMLVVLDNAFDVDQVRPLLPGAPGNVVVITSRNQLSGLVAVEGAQLVTLEPLTRKEARRFLARRIGRDRVEAEPQIVDEIINDCGGLPLALATVAARAAIAPGLPLDALAAELREARPLDALISSDASVDVRASFSWSYRGLSGDAARLFRLLGQHPTSEVSLSTATRLAGLPPRDVRGLLVELCCVNLLQERAPGRYAMHGLLQAYAAELAGADRVDAGDFGDLSNGAAWHRMAVPGH
jgi:DNA-binding SARP family transcriptional activator